MTASQHLAPSISLTLSPSSSPANIASSAKRPKISKRQNARLQLAAALIEADNEALEAKAQAQLEDAAVAAIYDEADEPMPAPAPPPEPKLASESVMFAPFRSNSDDYDAQSVARQPSRTRSIQRPQSKDFLGVNLPGQDRYQQDGAAAAAAAAASIHTHSRNVSLSSRNLGDDDRMSVQYPTSRPGSALSLATSRPASSLRSAGLDRPTSVFSQLSQTADGIAEEQQQQQTTVAEDGLGDWGLDKFLTNEARQRITAARELDCERKRAISMVEVTPPAEDSPPRRPTASTRSRKGSTASSVAVARPWSPSAGSSRRPLSFLDAPQRQRAKSNVMTTRAPASRSPDLDLLARIKLYRERQENLPPSQWGETPVEPTAAVAAEPAAAKEEDAPLATAGETGEQRAAGDAAVPFPAGPPAEEAVVSQDTKPPTTPEPARPEDVATKAATQDVIESAASDAASLRREGRVSWHQVSPTTPVDIVRRESVKGYTGESWSEQGSELSHPASRPATSRSISTSKPSSLVADHLESTAEEQDNPQLSGAPLQADGDDDEALTIRRLSMAGIGSMAHSRAGSADTAQPPTSMAQHGRHRSFAPSPLGGGGWAGSASRPVSPAFMPASLPSSAHLDTVAALHGDYFSALALGPSPYSVIDQMARAGQASPPPLMQRAGDGPRSSHMSPRIGGALSMPGSPEQQHAQLLSPRMPTSGAALSTRQLQELARHSAFPESYGISQPFALTEAEEQEQRIQEAQDAAAAGQYGWQELEPVESLPSDGWVPERQEGLLSKAFKPMTGFFMSSSASSGAMIEKLKQDVARMEPDLSSARWGRKKKAQASAAVAATAATAAEQPMDPVVPPIDPATTGHEPGIDDSLSRQTMDAVSDGRVPFDDLKETQEQDEDDDGVDDDYISPPSKGKLRPHGVEYWLPEVLVMPGLLEGSAEQPRTMLSQPDEDEYSRATKQHRRRQSGLYVPEGFVLHDAKGAAVSHIAPDEDARPRRTAFIYPIAAPRGIGRRALMSSTVLFRNQLVRRDEDREGWGWESTSVPLVPGEGPMPADEGEQAKLSKRERRKAEKTASKEAKARLKRKRARAVRRRTRRRAQREGKTCAEVGVAEESPVEDLSLTEDSEGDLSASGEESGFDSDEEPRWVDDARPAGKLFGKSLMDVAEEKRTQRLANRRFYGQQELDAGRDSADLAVGLDGGSVTKDSGSPYHSNEHTAAPSIIAPSIAGARSFRDNTGGGYNDTRERMQAAFGVDANWAREMAKRRDEEREEEEQRRITEEARLQLEEEKKARKEARRAKKGIFARQRKVKGQHDVVAGVDAQQQPDSGFAVAAEVGYDGMEQATAEEQLLTQEAPASPPRPKTPLEPPRLDVPVSSHAHPSTNGGSHSTDAFGVAQWLLPDSSDESSASDDEQRGVTTHQQPRRQIAPRIELGRLANDSSDSEDDEVPLAQLKRKSVMTLAPMLLSPRPSNLAGEGRDSSDEEDEHMTLAQLERKSQGAASVLMSSGSGVGVANSPRKSAAASVRPSTTSSSFERKKAVAASSSSSSDDEVPLAQLRNTTSKPSALRGPTSSSHLKPDTTTPQSASASDEDRPLGLRQGASQAVAAALATLQAKQHQPHGGENGESDEDDVPLGSTHPQAAIIARQAAQIRQMQVQMQQEEEARQRMSMMGMGMGMMGMPMGMGTPMMPHQWAPQMMMGGGGGGMDAMSMGGMAGMPPSSTMMMSMPQFPTAPTVPSMVFSPAMMQQQQQQQQQAAYEDAAALMSSPPLMPMGQTPAEAVKASSIERWRDDVR